MAYPNSIQSRESLHAPINNFATVLTAGMDAVQTTVPIAAKTIGSVSLPSTGMVSIGKEVIYYTSITTVGGGYQLNIGSGGQRGYDNTVASPHGAGERVEVRWVAAHHNALANLLFTLQTVLGPDILDGAIQLGPGQNFTSVASKLALTLPEVRSISPATTDWSVDHGRRRVVGVQLYEYVVAANEYRLFEAPNSQVVDPAGPGPSTVTIEPFAVAKEGVIVLL